MALCSVKKRTGTTLPLTHKYTKL